jgi:hypothetical protein
MSLKAHTPTQTEIQVTVFSIPLPLLVVSILPLKSSNNNHLGAETKTTGF